MFEHAKFIPASRPLQFPLPQMLSSEILPCCLLFFRNYLKSRLPRVALSDHHVPLLAVFHHITLLKFIHDAYCCLKLFHSLSH